MRALTIIALCALPLASFAQEDDAPSLMEEGARTFLEGLLREMDPALRELEGLGPQLRDFAEQMGPALGELMEEVRDWSAYHPPEVLPNGDIIIRRKEPEPPDPPEELDREDPEDTPDAEPSAPVDI
jgi:hypothetical protein